MTFRSHEGPFLRSERTQGFLRILFTERRGVRLCWEKSKPKGPKSKAPLIECGEWDVDTNLCFAQTWFAYTSSPSQLILIPRAFWGGTSKALILFYFALTCACSDQCLPSPFCSGLCVP